MKYDFLQKLDKQIELRTRNGLDVNCICCNNVTALLMFGNPQHFFKYKGIRIVRSMDVELDEFLVL